MEVYQVDMSGRGPKESLEILDGHIGGEVAHVDQELRISHLDTGKERETERERERVERRRRRRRNKGKTKENKGFLFFLLLFLLSCVFIEARKVECLVLVSILIDCRHWGKPRDDRERERWERRTLIGRQLADERDDFLPRSHFNPQRLEFG